MTVGLRLLSLIAATLLGACGSAPRRDLDYDRLRASLQALADDPALAKLALAERALAEAAVRRLDASSINADAHVQLAYLAERRVDIAYIAAQTEQESARLADLQREHAGLLLAASRRETAAMRAELDRQRQRELLQQEDALRGTSPAVAAAPAASATVEPAPAAAPAAPAAESAAATAPSTGVAQADAAATQPASALAQRLAVLMPENGAQGSQMTLEDLVFEPGTAQLVADAAAGLARVAAWLRSQPSLPVRIEGHTDATGSPQANRQLSLRRAEAVRDALLAAGIDAARIAVSGEGAAQPVASNDDAAGRARNRRVVVLLRDARQ